MDSDESFLYDTINFRPVGCTFPSLVIHNPYDEVDFSSCHHYKANLHTHTTQSDGTSSPSQVIAHYHDVGSYDLLAITDHNKNTWPWGEFIAEPAEYCSSSSAYYPDLGMLAISGNEFSLRHHRSSLLNDYPFGGFFMRFSFWYVQQQDGISFFNHPGRYDYDESWYQQFFDRYDSVVGIEVYNQGDRYDQDRLLWDEINRNRDPDDLIWGFSNDDMHRIHLQAFRNYQHLLMDELTEDEFRDALSDGAFSFSYEPDGANMSSSSYGAALTPKLIDVTINGSKIQLTAEEYDNVEWYDEDSQIIARNTTLDVSLVESTFVRAVFSNDFGWTYTQPFGLEKDGVFDAV